jgi:hypothetical protein
LVPQLVAIAFAADPNKCTSLLERRNKRWGNRNIMELGYIGHLRTFIASKCTVARFFLVQHIKIAT